MSTPTNHWKLGLFMVAGLLLGLATLVYLGAQSLQRQTVSYHSFFDEAVTGLEAGSPVKFRGVTVGNVSIIAIAPDRRHVDIAFDLDIDQLRKLGIAIGEGKKTKISLPPGLRMQIGSTGITGVKYLQLDFFTGTPVATPLPFATPENHIPSEPSTMKNLEDSVVQAAQRLPELTGGIIQLLGTANQMLLSLDEKKLSDRAASTLSTIDETAGLLKVKLGQVQSERLSSQAEQTLAGVTQAVNHMNQILDRVDGKTGFLASAQRASDSVGDVTRNAVGVGNELELTLRELREAAESVRNLADALGDEPDMLLKGRAKRKTQ